MIKVLILRENNKFVSLKVKGHANSAPYGKDLVCAAVSAVITGGLNNIHEINNLNVVLEEGNVEVEVKNTLSSHDEIVLETIIRSLETIEESNHQFIEIKNL